MKKKDSYVLAIDFDGTLCEYAFPEIGEQKKHHKDLMQLLIQLKKDGHKLILWTCRGNTDEYPCLTEAINWCKSQGLEFDAVNENISSTKKLSGYSPKVVADYYIDDKALTLSESSSKEILLLLSNLTIK